ncbi:MAG TPA: zinc ribbon domain-containing protein [Ktedonobacteraceae bacterium]
MAGLAKFRYYGRKKLLALMIGYVVNLVLVILPALSGNTTAENTRAWLNAVANIGFLLFIVQAIFVMLYDWYGAVTLRGWTRSRAWQESLLGDFKILYVALYVIFPEIMLPIYLIRIASGRHQAEAERELARKRQISGLEAQLGIMPPTNGTCRACHKPVQVGAEFCQYCGVPVVAHPKVCPVCATTTLPDAKWCPHCGASLR